MKRPRRISIASNEGRKLHALLLNGRAAYVDADRTWTVEAYHPAVDARAARTLAAQITKAEALAMLRGADSPPPFGGPS